MAQPQGLNVPAIITTGIVTVILTGVIVEGVRALYAFELPRTEAHKWDDIAKMTPRLLRDEQEMNLGSYKTSVPIEEAKKQVVAKFNKVTEADRWKTSTTDAGVAIGSDGDTKHNVIATLISDSRRFSENGQYGDALKVVEQILVLDPKNDYANGIRPILNGRGGLHPTKRSEDNQTSAAVSDVIIRPVPWSDNRR